jgi:hypothetical protein
VGPILEQKLRFPFFYIPSGILNYTISEVFILIILRLFTPHICATLYESIQKLKFFILFNNSLIMKNTSTLIIFVILVFSIFVVFYLQNVYHAVSATIVDAKSQLMPFDNQKILESGQSQNETTKNSSNIVADDTSDQTTDCEMPPCPPGQACIQSCP